MDAGVTTTLGAVRLVTWTNFWLAVLNLLPAVPMDGGRAARGLLWSLVGYRRAVRYTRVLLLVTAAAICLGPTLLRTQEVVVSPLVELSLVGLGIFLFLGAQDDVSRRKPREAEPVEAEEWRVYGPELSLTADDMPFGPAVIGQAIEARREEKLHRQQAQEEEEDRLVDEILSRLHVVGADALSAEDQALLNRVSARYRGRKGK
jgi:hypothetical protein